MTSAEDLWADFLRFLQVASNMGSPLELMEGFERHRLDQGATEEQAAADRLLVLQLTNDRNEWIGPMFDRIYSSDEPSFRVAPNEFLVDVLREVTPGRALDIAMGQGRNSIFLATRGWQVTGIDVSASGLEIAQRDAVLAGVSIATHHLGIEAFDLGEQRWDLIVMTYALVPVTDREFASQIVESMTSGGLLVVESFGATPDEDKRRPVDLEPDQLRAAYGSLDIFRFEDTRGQPEWTDRPGRVIRLAARRP